MAGFLDFEFASDEEVSLELGARLKAVRLQKGFRQADLAAAASLAPATLKALENKGTCTLSSLIQVVRALGLGAELQGLFLLPEPSSIAAMQAQTQPTRKRASAKRQRAGAP